MSWHRFELRGSGLEVQSVPEMRGGYEDHCLSIAFSPRETFHELVTRLARQVNDDQIKLAIAGLENEMGRRSR